MKSINLNFIQQLERLFLNKEQLENLKQQQDAWNTLGVTIKLAFRKWISDQSIANDGLKSLATNTDQVTELVNVLGTAFNNLVTSAKWAYKWLKKIWNFISDLWNKFLSLFEKDDTESVKEPEEAVQVENNTVSDEVILDEKV